MQYLKNVVTLQYDPEKCVGCGLCATVCPHTIFVMNEGRAAIAGRDGCMECGACMRNCPAAAIRVQTGVGCATGLMQQALGLKGDCTCSQGQSCCG